MNETIFSNRLITESSPYLLQHAHNPVNWYPWGDEALNKAKTENKLLMISIGYAACHWCHVMAHESFEDSEIAAFINENFIPVKVDREERPDIDQVYMNAVQLLSGTGGWPLNVIALPDGRPLYGGTYFPRDRWLEILRLIIDFVKNNPLKAEEEANTLTDAIRTDEFLHRDILNPVFTADDLKEIFKNWKRSFDPGNGGYLGAPKFPLPAGLMFLLQYYKMTGDKAAFNFSMKTLDKMAYGGIYDQLGGGFSRYSTDEFWKVPHFEKMLYDNSQLVSLYSRAFQLTKTSLYKDVVLQTLEFVERELTSPESGFFSSIDADSEGEEGKFYVWLREEFRSVTGSDSDLMTDYYNITEKGNWEGGRNVLFRKLNDEEIAEKYKLSMSELNDKLTVAKTNLFSIRSRRRRPGTDDKILTCWNALMLKAYVDAYRIFDRQEYLNAALNNAWFILGRMKFANNRLERCYKNGKAYNNAFLDDYAFTIEALISLYQATFNENWLQDAKNLNDYVLAHFFDSETAMFFYTSDLDLPLVVRKIEISDNVLPSSNSVMARNLFMLGTYFYIDEYIEIARRMAGSVRDDAKRSGTYYASWDILISWFVKPPFEIAIVGDNYETIRKQFDKFYLPDVFFSGGKEEGTLSLLANKLVPGQTTIYVCWNKTCKLPVTDVDEAMLQITYPDITE